MARRPSRDDRPNSAAILATTFVLVGGLGACAMIILSSTTNPLIPMSVLACGVMVFAFFHWLLGARRSEPLDLLLWFRRAPAKRKVQLRFHRSKAAVSEQAEPASGPPTAESVRELKEKHNVWVRNAPASARSSESASQE